MQAPKTSPHLMHVTKAAHFIRNKIRVTLGGAVIQDMGSGCEGAHCKIFLPQMRQRKTDFAAQLIRGPRPTVRTYTIRYIRPEKAEIDIDFVDHGDAGPASAWARAAHHGDFCGFVGPGSVKLRDFYADYYIVAADMSGLPVVAATLEAMPRDANGVAFFEIRHQDDAQHINAPPGIALYWMLHGDTSQPNRQLLDAIEEWEWPKGRVQTCIAGESKAIKAIRYHLLQERRLPKRDCYISGYWKIGLIEDEHREMQRMEATSSCRLG